MRPWNQPSCFAEALKMAAAEALARLGCSTDEALDQCELLEEGPLAALLVNLCSEHRSSHTLSDGPRPLAQLQASLEQQQQEVAALKGEASQLSSRALLCNTYRDHLRQLQLVFQQYGQSVEQQLQRLALANQQAAVDKENAGGSSAGLQEYLQNSEKAVRGALEAKLAAGSGQLLQLRPDGCPSTLTAAAVFPAVQAGQADDAQALQSLVRPSDADKQGQQEPGPRPQDLLDSLQQRHWQEFTDVELVRQQQAELEQQLQQEHEAAARETDEEQRTHARLKQLAAQQAGIKAAMQLCEQLSLELKDEQAAAAAQQEKAQQAMDALVQLEKEEEELDHRIQALCAADNMFMRQWREGTWQVQGFISDSLLAARQPLQQLGDELTQALQEELEAFQGMAWPNQSAYTRLEAAPSTLEGAALRIDSMAHLKTADHCGHVLAKAAEELQALRPVHEAWGELAASKKAELQQLRATAGALQQEVAGQDGASSQVVFEQLDKACSLAEEGMAAVQSARSALGDWWSLPAVKAVSWMKYEDKTAAEWLQLLAEQQELLLQRDVFKDVNNRRKG